MKLEKTLEYADEATYAEFERQRLYFRATNNRDIEQVLRSTDSNAFSCTVCKLGSIKTLFAIAL